jgi:tetratricopeptide (TPR) repeat protein
MDFAEQLRCLQAARDNPALLALATVDLAHPALPAAERSRVKDALLAAAVPHWCDSPFLAALLETTPEEGDRLLGHLRVLTVIEPFPARGEHAVNVHEATRLVLRDHLRTTNAACWKALSNRAFAHVRQGTEAHSRIEALYHLFATDQHAAATACEALDREFTAGRPEVRLALALALTELTVAGWLTGAAQVEALLASLELRNWRGEVAQLEDEARNISALARSAAHPSGIGRAQCLLGDVLHSKGRLDDAVAAFHEGLAIYKRLAATDPSNTDWQHDLACAHSRVGDIAQTQGRFDDALTAFQEDLAISKRLAATDPSNAGWQRDLAVAHSRVGDIAQVQGHLDDALTAFQEYLAISKRLAATDPSNGRWQRELAIAHLRVGEVAREQGHLDDAVAAFHEGLVISKRLAATDPSNAGWQRGLAVAHSRVGDIAQVQGHLDDALTAFQEYLAISKCLAATDPSNVQRHRDVAHALNKLGQVFRRMGSNEDAQSSFRYAVETIKLAIATSPGHIGLKNDLAKLEFLLSSEAS